jgi:DNA repair protein RecN (Recombination protein N)
MIIQLTIRNFAIIDRLSLSLQPGLNVLTGETGAGKSIILNAANLILGGRPSADLIRTGEKELHVEAAFHVEEGPAPELLATWGMEPSLDLVLRREVTKKGPNKVFINGNLATVAMLAALGPHVMSIAGQHDQQILTQPESHLDYLDEFAGLEKECARISEMFAALQEAVRERRSRAARRERDAERLELLRFQFREIEGASLSPEEDEELETERVRLRNAEGLSQTAQSGYEDLYGGDQSQISRASMLQTDLQRKSALDPILKPLSDRLQSAILELEDIALELRDYSEKVVFDPARLEWVENRLADIKTLGRKYGGGAASILARQKEIAEEIEQLESRNISLEELDKRVAEHAEGLCEISRELSKKREEHAERLARRMEEELAALNMEKLIFQVRIEPLGKQEKDSYQYKDKVLGPKGMDTVSFLLSPNPGEEPRPLARIASGGELSRILLALKGILAGRGEVETLVFDEVDSGIGGETAEKVGVKLRQLSRIHQVLCITHLPQIACFADHHFLVSKHVTGGRTQTRVGSLDDADRVDEIARMLGGSEAKGKALAYARELIAGVKSKK